MSTTRFTVWVLPVACMCLWAAGLCGQPYPNKPIRIVTTEVGADSDFMARLIAQGISGPLGQPVVVENRPSGTRADIVARASADGYTVLVHGSSLWIVTLLRKTSYDLMADFSPITLAEMSPNVLVVHPLLSSKTVKELITLAKAEPGTLNYSSGSTGGSGHLAAELLNSMTGIHIVRISYKGGGPALNAVISGEVQLTFAGATTVTSPLKTGRLRALAVTSAEPSTLFPEIPAVAATVPGYVAVGMTGIFAPAKTPLPIINRLNREIVRFLSTPEAKEKFLNIGSETVGSSPQELDATMKAELHRWGKIIRDAGIKAD